MPSTFSSTSQVPRTSTECDLDNNSPCFLPKICTLSISTLWLKPVPLIFRGQLTTRQVLLVLSRFRRPPKTLQTMLRRWLPHRLPSGHFLSCLPLRHVSTLYKLSLVLICVSFQVVKYSSPSVVLTGTPTLDIGAVTKKKSDCCSIFIFRKSPFLPCHDSTPPCSETLALPRLLQRNRNLTALSDSTQNRSLNTTTSLSTPRLEPPHDLHSICQSHQFLGQTKWLYTTPYGSKTTLCTQAVTFFPSPQWTTLICIISLTDLPLVVHHFRTINAVGHCHPRCSFHSILHEGDILNPGFYSYRSIYQDHPHKPPPTGEVQTLTYNSQHFLFSRCYKNTFLLHLVFRRFLLPIHAQ